VNRGVQEQGRIRLVICQQNRRCAEIGVAQWPAVVVWWGEEDWRGGENKEGVTLAGGPGGVEWDHVG